MKLLGVEVDALLEEDLHALLIEATNIGVCRIFANHNLHSIYLFHRDEKFKRFFAKAHYIHVDGMPIIWAARLLGKPLHRANRLTSLDWIIPLLRTCAKQQLNVFLLGAAPGVAEKAAEVFREATPELALAYHHGYFDLTPDSKENAKVIEQINAFQTHVLLVGMGMPRQEHWILDYSNKVNVNVIWALGAFMDYFAGEQKLPPRWTGRLGLEGCYRLVSNPRRLWRRYLVEPWFIIGLLVRDLLSQR